ncbi:unnamed protein product, partial [Rotaria socialis]
MFSCTVRLTSLLRSAINVPTSSKLLQTILVKNNSTNTIPEPTISYSDSALVLSLILPSRQETCRFHLNLHTTTVGQLIDEIQQEDAGIEHVQIFDKKGTLFSKSCG